VPASGGTCPAGYSNQPVDCRPCNLRYASAAYCVNSACCGTFGTNGVVKGGCTCYGCNGSAYDFNQSVAQSEAEANSHKSCAWPMGANQTLCPYFESGYVVSCGGTCP
jgi:hypothetical protein